MPSCLSLPCSSSAASAELLSSGASPGLFTSRLSQARSRRRWLAEAGCLLAAAPSVTGQGCAVEPSPPAFRLAAVDGRWWLIDAKGQRFFSRGLNHIDPSPLRQPSAGDLWQTKYGNSMERWLKEAVAPDLRQWGFNSVGWTQEVVSRGLSNHRHSRPFTYEEYQWLGMPYCHQLPFADFHQWDNEVRHPDFRSREFAEWCDYVAREHCARMRTDPNLIGYFYIDCPVWIHTREGNRWKGPLFDPSRLVSDAGKRELRDLAAAYYRITYEAVRRYDPHHLILGDRYEAGQPIAVEVIEAALPYVDALSFQHFAGVDQIQRNLLDWHRQTGKPVLLADHAAVDKRADGSQGHNGRGYAAVLAALQEVPGCVGYHLCGAYLRNEVRRRALRNADESLDGEAAEEIAAANRANQAWVDRWLPR
jgi:hypothetical protein